VDESPRWLWAQGQAQKAVDIVEKAMKQNGCTEKLDVAYFVAKGEGKIIVSDTPDAGLIDLVKTPNLRSRTFNVVFNWCVFCVFNLPRKEGKRSSTRYINPLEYFRLTFLFSLGQHDPKRNLTQHNFFIPKCYCSVINDFVFASILRFLKSENR